MAAGALSQVCSSRAVAVSRLRFARALRMLCALSAISVFTLVGCGDDDGGEQTRAPSTGAESDDDSDGSPDDDEDDAVDEKPPSRIDGGVAPAKDGAARPSVRDASAMRDAVVREPTPSDAGSSGRPDTSVETPDGGDMGGGRRAPAISLNLPTMKESPMVAPHFNVYRPTDLSATGEPLPVVLWANGGCFRAEDTWKQLFDRWAKSGFVVLALTATPGGLGALSQSTVDDQNKLVDWVVEQNNKQGGPYAGKLDLKRIVAAGNSCGGVTALGVAAKDMRIASVFVLSGSSAVGSVDRNVMGKIKVPVGYVVGGTEDIARANAEGDYAALSAGVPAMIVSRASGEHQTVSTDMMILDDVAEISLHWLDLSLYGTQEAYDQLSSSKVCAGCDAGPWTLKQKELQKLVK